MTMKTIESKALAGIDWTLLSVQKEDLVATIENVLEEGVRDSLDGILHLLDAIQDEHEDGIGPNESEDVAPPGILEAAKGALEVLKSITDRLYVPDLHSRANLDESEIAEIFIEVIQGSAELSQAIKATE